MPSMEGGGAERVVSHLCRFWKPEDGIEIHLVLIYAQSEIVYSLPEYVTIHHLNCKRVLSAALPCFRIMKQLKPDVVFSSMSNVNMLILGIKWFMPQLNVVIRENNLPSLNLEYDNFKFFRNIAYKVLYPLANKIICQSEAMKQDFQKHYSKIEQQLEVIENPVVVRVDEFKNPFVELGSGPHILVVGRLSAQKNCGRAIEIFKKWIPEIPEAHLWFLGEGEDRDELVQQSEAFHLRDRIHFPGFVKNIEAWLSHADLFLMCSRFEGSPNALLEALTMNCPVLVEAHPGGTEEMMKTHAQEQRYLENIGAFKPSFFERSTSSNMMEEIQNRNSRIAEQFLNCFGSQRKV